MCTKQAPRVCRQVPAYMGNRWRGQFWVLVLGFLACLILILPWLPLGFGRNRCSLDWYMAGLRENKVRRTVANDKRCRCDAGYLLYFIFFAVSRRGRMGRRLHVDVIEGELGLDTYGGGDVG